MVFSGQDGINRILEELKNEITVYHFEKEDRGYSIGGCGIEPYFTMEFDFDNVGEIDFNRYILWSSLDFGEFINYHKLTIF